MRRALDLIHYTVTEGVGDCDRTMFSLDFGPFAAVNKGRTKVVTF